MKKGKISFKVSPKVSKALRQMASEGRKVRVVGQVKKGGIVEINYKELAELSKKFPNSTISFVALNAPFKTKALVESR